MNRAFWIVGPVLAVAFVLAVAAAFYWGGDGWGHHTETVQIIGNGGTDSSGHTVDVVRVVDPGDHRHWGFFPLAFLGPLLGLFFIFFIFRVLFFGGRWRHRYEFAHDGWHHHHDGGGGQATGSGASFEEWHRKQHERTGQGGENGEKPANPSDS